MSRSLCQRCSAYSCCALNYDGKPCREIRDVEATNYDKIKDMDLKQLAAFLADWAENVIIWQCDEGAVEAFLKDTDWRRNSR